MVSYSECFDYINAVCLQSGEDNNAFDLSPELPRPPRPSSPAKLESKEPVHHGSPRPKRAPASLPLPSLSLPPEKVPFDAANGNSVKKVNR